MFLLLLSFLAPISSMLCALRSGPLFPLKSYQSSCIPVRAVYTPPVIWICRATQLTVEVRWSDSLTVIQPFFQSKHYISVCRCWCFSGLGESASSSARQAAFQSEQCCTFLCIPVKWSLVGRCWPGARDLISCPYYSNFLFQEVFFTIHV